MNYIEITNDAIQYIESNLHRKLCLEELATRYYISPMHFYRIFRAVTNQTVKSYILGRRLSEAAIALKNTDYKVVDIAFQYGFNSHELLSRNFQKKFKVSPSQYRKKDISVSLIQKMKIIERDFRNKNKDIIVDYSYRELKEIKLLGKEIILHPENSDELDEAIFKLYDFTKKYIIQGTAKRLFNIIRDDSNNPSRTLFFYAIASEEHLRNRSGLTERSIPESRYAIFRYPRFMGLVFDTVIKDLNKWFSATELEFNNNAGINMFELYTEDYTQTGKFYLCVPVL